MKVDDLQSLYNKIFEFSLFTVQFVPIRAVLFRRPSTSSLLSRPNEIPNTVHFGIDIFLTNSTRMTVHFHLIRSASNQIVIKTNLQIRKLPQQGQCTFYNFSFFSFSSDDGFWVFTENNWSNIISEN